MPVNITVNAGTYYLHSHKPQIVFLAHLITSDTFAVSEHKPYIICNFELLNPCGSYITQCSLTACDLQFEMNEFSQDIRSV